MKIDINNDLVTLTREEYEELLNDQKILAALIAGGVENWEWYDQSLIYVGI